MSESITVHSIVHDHRVEVSVPSGFAEGQRVSVTIHAVDATESSIPAQSGGIASAFGILSQEEGEELDRFLAESRSWHVIERRDQAPGTS